MISRPEVSFNQIYSINTYAGPLTEVWMRATAVSYQPALDALAKYRLAHESILSADDRETLDEIAYRMARLEAQAAELIKMNNVMVEAEVPIMEFDSESDTLTFRLGDLENSIQLRRADPNVPITVNIATAGGGYKAGSGDAANPDERLKFEELVEAYYYNAHRVLKLVRSLPGLKRFKCWEITMVRNKLVEHPKRGQPYSFGFGLTGPRVKPMQRGGPEWNDNGLVPNTEAFVARLVRALNPTA